MTEDGMLAEVGELEEALLELCKGGYLEVKLEDDGEISIHRTEKPVHKLELDHVRPRIRRVATDVLTKMLPLLDALKEEREKEFEEALRGLERDGLIRSELGDDGEVYIAATEKAVLDKADDEVPRPYPRPYLVKFVAA